MEERHDTAGTSRSARRRYALLASFLFLAGFAAGFLEYRHSRVQAEILSWITRDIDFKVETGPSQRWLRAPSGPYDKRLGYNRLGEWNAKLPAKGYNIANQARPTERAFELAQLGITIPYAEKTSTGLRIEDMLGHSLLETRYPGRQVQSFDEIPALVRKALLFIENRELLSFESPHQNPAVEWDRLLHASILQILPTQKRRPGGSTLATQIEKYRHSEGGITRDASAKLKQMARASLRAYQGGTDTRAARERIVLEYVNSVPLAAKPGFGEIRGLGDGLYAWHNADINQIFDLLQKPNMPGQNTDVARAFRQVLSLFLAQRRPSELLIHNQDALDRLTDRYLTLLHREGWISTSLYTNSRKTKLAWQAGKPTRPKKSKVVSNLQREIASLLGTESNYDLERYDLRVQTSLHSRVQTNVENALERLSTTETLPPGFLGKGLLRKGQNDALTYSFVLYERDQGRNWLRAKVDTHPSNFDINEQTKLDLGSTAKLRTLVTYLEVVSEIFEQVRQRAPELIDPETAHPRDGLTRFVLQQLRSNPQTSLAELIDAAMKRRYSASPWEVFFTGGGRHRFHNFDPDQNSLRPTVESAFAHSMNLPFVRMLEEVINHFVFREGGAGQEVLYESSSPRRRAYLERFADREGRLFIRRFLKRHRNKTPTERAELLLKKTSQTPRRYALVLRFLFPNLSEIELTEKIHNTLPNWDRWKLDSETLHDIYLSSEASNYSLTDRAFLTRLHPLELFTVRYLNQFPNSSEDQLFEAGKRARLDAYRWLFRTRYPSRQNQRLWTILEEDAFFELKVRWRRMGYPFDRLVPSFATALGASADRPSALAELLGMIQNDGIRYPQSGVSTLQFAAHTPYETGYQANPAAGTRVLPAEAAHAVRKALFRVVERGTALRARGALNHAALGDIRIGGKTGTADTRLERFDRHGNAIESRAVRRAATLAFVAGDRHYGVITAYVSGPEAAKYEFTSSLASQVLHYLGPELAPLFETSPSEGYAMFPKANGAVDGNAPTPTS